MKNTILSEKDVLLMEKTILQYGRIVRIESLMQVFQQAYSKAAAHNRIGLLSKLGWLRRLKQGLYVIVDTLSGRFHNDISLIKISNTLMEDSYVSLSYALNYYQMFDQYGKTVTAITDKKTKKFIFDDFTFQYSKVKKSMYFGFSEKIENSQKIRIADAEKALIDYLYLDKSFGSASLVFEKMKNHHQSLDLIKLQKYAIKSVITVIRKIGFMLDGLKLNSDTLRMAVMHNRGISRFTKESKLFNAKWRIYYDDRIIG